MVGGGGVGLKGGVGEHKEGGEKKHFMYWAILRGEDLTCFFLYWAILGNGGGGKKAYQTLQV